MQNTLDALEIGTVAIQANVVTNGVYCKTKPKRFLRRTNKYEISSSRQRELEILE
jgi:hypothetical protein